ncbi:MAG TPA: hypothetical protein VFG83_16615 [Kofleriaceae bacterium]|nr:hypothetical protein [Kofleriaceae bacterium]
MDDLRAIAREDLVSWIGPAAEQIAIKKGVDPRDGWTVIVPSSLAVDVVTQVLRQSRFPAADACCVDPEVLVYSHGIPVRSSNALSVMLLVPDEEWQKYCARLENKPAQKG